MKRRIFFLSFIIIVLIVLNGCQDYSKKAAQKGLEIMAKENPSKLLPNRCSMPSGLVCKNFRVTDTEIEFSMINAMGYDFQNVRINVDSCSKSAMAESWKNNEEKRFTLSDCRNREASQDGIFKNDITINYVDDTIDRKAVGEVFYKLE